MKTSFLFEPFPIKSFYFGIAETAKRIDDIAWLTICTSWLQFTDRNKMPIEFGSYSWLWAINPLFCSVFSNVISIIDNILFIRNSLINQIFYNFIQTTNRRGLKATLPIGSLSYLKMIKTCIFRTYIEIKDQYIIFNLCVVYTVYKVVCFFSYIYLAIYFEEKEGTVIMLHLPDEWKIFYHHVNVSKYR